MDLTIMVMIISAAAAISGIALGWTARSRETRREVKTQGETGGAIRTDMEYLKRGIDDIRVEQRVQGQRMDVMGERVTRVEESTKQAHKRIDEHIAQERS